MTPLQRSKSPLGPVRVSLRSNIMYFISKAFLRCRCTSITYGFSPLTVSVCQNVSTTGHLPWPTASWSQCHASGLMGSPTEPRTFRLDRSYLETSKGRPSEISLFSQTSLSSKLTSIIAIHSYLLLLSYFFTTLIKLVGLSLGLRKSFKFHLVFSFCLKS